MKRKKTSAKFSTFPKSHRWEKKSNKAPNLFLFCISLLLLLLLLRRRLPLLDDDDDQNRFSHRKEPHSSST